MSYPEIFDQCKATERSQYRIDEVFVQDGVRYATDGRICVRMAADEPDTEGKFPDPASLPWGSAETWVDLPDLLPPQHTDCVECDGDGQFGCDCPNCPVWHDCPSCKDGIAENQERVAIRHTGFSAYLLGIIAGAGVTRIKLHPKAEGPAYFETEDGVQGLVMPMAVTAPAGAK